MRAPGTPADDGKRWSRGPLFESLLLLWEGVSREGGARFWSDRCQNGTLADLFLVLFSNFFTRFPGWFLDAFWSDLGVILGAFWPPFFSTFSP